LLAFAVVALLAPEVDDGVFSVEGFLGGGLTLLGLEGLLLSCARAEKDTGAKPIVKIISPVRKKLIPSLQLILCKLNIMQTPSLKWGTYQNHSSKVLFEMMGVARRS